MALHVLLMDKVMSSPYERRHLSEEALYQCHYVSGCQRTCLFCPISTSQGFKTCTNKVLAVLCNNQSHTLQLCLFGYQREQQTQYGQMQRTAGSVERLINARSCLQ
jgi:hypothetical protein